MNATNPNKSIKVVIVTDPNYLQAASITTSELTLLTESKFKLEVTLAVVRSKTLTSAHYQTLKKVIKFGVETFLIEDLPILQFQKAHFNETILYKILVPSLFSSKVPILILDAGLIPGDNFLAWLDKTIAYLQNLTAGWVFAAHCNADPPGALGSHLAKFAPNAKLYPAATLMFCNTENYRLNNAYSRLIANYNKHRTSLFYAEQELLCITLNNNELCELDGVNDRWTPFLHLGQDVNSENISWTRPREKYIYYKIVGPIKPWSSEVRDLYDSLAPYYQAEKRMRERQ
jgi:lipopolysaccharide biosynthesis glycosyltransferase